MIVDNPFTRVYAAIWDCLESSPHFKELFKPGNVVRYDQTPDRGKLKETIATADLPEVILIDSGAQFNPMNTSSTSMFLCTFDLMISTGDYNWSQYLAAINWMVACNWSKWKTKLGTVTWRGTHPVKICRVLDIQTGESIPSRNRGIEGFTTIWKLQVEMHLPTAHLVFTESESL